MSGRAGRTGTTPVALRAPSVAPVRPSCVALNKFPFLVVHDVLALPAVHDVLALETYRLQVRTTTDLDIVLDLSEESYHAVRAVLEQDGWSVQPTGGERREFPDIVRLRHQSYFPTDLLLAKTPYQVVAVQRARLLDPIALGFPLPYLSPEDVVIHKLLAYRFRDRDDLESLAKAGITLDEAYVQHWCDEWEIRDRWDEYRRSQ